MKKNSLFALLLAFVLAFSACSAPAGESASTPTLTPAGTPIVTPSATATEPFVSETAGSVTTPAITPTIVPTIAQTLAPTVTSTITPTNTPTIAPSMNAGTQEGDTTITLSNIPAYSGNTFVAINDNVPFFTKEELTTTAYENYSDLDALGRCGVVMACCGQEIMPTGERGDISSIKPTGWVQVKYDFVDGKYLYNRSHLIGWQLSGENANEKNLITGTRYFNTEGMLPFENMVADYIKETDNHVMYRVTPIYDGKNLVAHGVLIEAYSVEDNGEGICFNVFCYNVQPGVVIDYTTGVSHSEVKPSPTATQDTSQTYILNTNSKKIHYPDCSSVSKMNDKNKQEYTGTLEDLLEDGYTTCGICF